jgi:hypothetical protein
MTRQNGKGGSTMASQGARLTFLRLIEEHEGDWGWYQFERAFPPGWFSDEKPTTTAKEILDRLERDGLVTTTPGETQRSYRLTDHGFDVLREAAACSTPTGGSVTEACDPGVVADADAHGGPPSRGNPGPSSAARY